MNNRRKIPVTERVLTVVAVFCILAVLCIAAGCGTTGWVADSEAVTLTHAKADGWYSFITGEIETCKKSSKSLPKGTQFYMIMSKDECTLMVWTTYPTFAIDPNEPSDE